MGNELKKKKMVKEWREQKALDQNRLHELVFNLYQLGIRRSQIKDKLNKLVCSELQKLFSLAESAQAINRWQVASDNIAMHQEFSAKLLKLVDRG